MAAIDIDPFGEHESRPEEPTAHVIYGMGSGGVILKNRKISTNYWFLRPCTYNLVKMQILGNFK